MRSYTVSYRVSHYVNVDLYNLCHKNAGTILKRGGGGEKRDGVINGKIVYNFEEGRGRGETGWGH